jgi:hypothetical protein
MLSDRDSLKSCDYEGENKSEVEKLLKIYGISL